MKIYFKKQGAMRKQVALVLSLILVISTFTANAAGETIIFRPTNTEETVTITETPVGSIDAASRYPNTFQSNATEIYSALAQPVCAGNELSDGSNFDMIAMTANNNVTWASTVELADSTTDYSLDGSGNLTIYTARGLAWFSNAVSSGNRFAGKTVTLANNIDILDANVDGYGSTVGWLVIGNDQKYFSGIFEGNGKTISNLYLIVKAHTNSNTRYGLFSTVAGSGAAVRNLIINGDINIQVSNPTASDLIAGGIVGRLDNAAIIGCESHVNIPVEYQKNVKLGGVAGAMYGSAIVEKSAYFGSITASSGTYDCIGGIVGYLKNTPKILNCYNRGTVLTNNSAAYTGGILGYVNASALIENCYSMGAVSGIGNYIGAINGYRNNNGTIANSYYLDTSSQKGIGTGAGNTTSKTLAQFASGEAAWLLNTSGGAAGNTHSGIWSQDAEKPVLADQKQLPIYQITITGAISEIVYSSENGMASSLPEGYRYLHNRNEFTAATPVSADIQITATVGQIISVTITWGSLDYTYTDGTWNPNTHEYDGGGWMFEEGANKIAVTSESNIKLLVGLEYCKNSGYEIFEGAFADNQNQPVTGALSLSKGDTVAVSFTPTGKPQNTLNRETIGSIIVTLETPSNTPWNGTADTNWYTSNQDASEYTIKTAEQLAGLAQLVNKGTTFEGKTIFLGGNLDLNGTIFNWKPIGFYAQYEWDYPEGQEEAPFCGTFDGRGYTINNMKIITPDEIRVTKGLFSYTLGAAIKNVGIVSCDISCIGDAGAIVGYASQSTIENCYNTGTIQGFLTSGGLVGINQDGSIINCYNAGTISSDMFVGGIVGTNSGLVRGCYNTGSVTGSDRISNVGGIVGTNEIWTGSTRADIINCYNSGAIQAKNYPGSTGGGIAGHLHSGTVQNSYNIGKVSGGLRTYFGGVIGKNSNGTMQTLYFLSGTAKNGIGTGTGSAAVQSAAELKALSPTLNGEQSPPPWIADTEPFINDGYPILTWKKP